MNKKPIQITLVLFILIVSGLFVNMTKVSFNPSPWSTVASFISTGQPGLPYSGGSYGGNSQVFNGYTFPINQFKTTNIDKCDYRLKLMVEFNGYNGQNSWTTYYLTPDLKNTSTSSMGPLPPLNFEFNLKNKSQQFGSIFSNTNFMNPPQLDYLKLTFSVGKTLQSYSNLNVRIGPGYNTNGMKNKTRLYLQEKCISSDSDNTPTFEPVAENIIKR